MGWLRMAAIGSLVLSAPAWLAAQDFRVETDVFVNQKKPPVASYLTIFEAGFVYDFSLDPPDEVTIYDVQRGRFLLFDPQRRVQAVVTLDELRQLTADVKVRAQTAGDENVRFLANPEFETKIDLMARSIVMQSKRLTYSAKGLVPPEPGIERRYTDFADGYARLNGLRQGNLPPFARMQLNQQLSAQGWTPEEVVRTIPAQAVLAKDYEVKSHHLFSWRVLPTDSKKIADAQNYITSFKAVTLAQYLNWPGAIANAK